MLANIIGLQLCNNLKKKFKEINVKYNIGVTPQISAVINYGGQDGTIKLTIQIIHLLEGGKCHK